MRYKWFLLVYLLACLSCKADCFLVVENQKTIIQKGNCDSRHSPCSSFKIALALMGYDAKFLKNEDQPRINFQEGFTDWMSIWREPHTPKLWIKNSCVWYSQQITAALGYEKFKKYLEQFHYGNQKVNPKTALKRSWISGSIQISPKEQIKFLENINNENLGLD